MSLSEYMLKYSGLAIQYANRDLSVKFRVTILLVQFVALIIVSLKPTIIVCMLSLQKLALHIPKCTFSLYFE